MKERLDDLLPCPFCGAQPTIEQISRNGLELKCSNCTMGYKQKTMHTIDWLKDKMIQRWNKRFPQSTPKQIEVEKGKEPTPLIPEIVCICGSGRFLKEMHEVEERLTLEGKIVLMIGVNTKDVARTENMEHYKPMLDKLHLRKIDLSKRVFIVNVDGYIGESTRKEIAYSEMKGKPIEYLNPNSKTCNVHGCKNPVREGEYICVECTIRDFMNLNNKEK